MGECYLEIKGRKCRIRFHFLFFFQNVRFLSDFGEEWIIMKRNYLVCIIVFAFFLSCRQVFLLLRLKGTLIAKIYGFKSIGIPIFRLDFQYYCKFFSAFTDRLRGIGHVKLTQAIQFVKTRVYRSKQIFNWRVLFKNLLKKLIFAWALAVC